jgi:type I restriction enzyme S subunit
MTAPKIRFKEFSENWGSKKIIELADYVDYRGKTPKKVESGVLLVTAKNIKQGYLDYSASQEFIEESAFDDVMRRGKVELNDVLITTEAPLGNVASVDRTDIALAQRVIKYRGKTGLLDNLFLKQKFLSESFQEILKSKATGGTVQGIKGSVLHQIPLIVPSKEEQTKIATFLSAVDEKISQLSQKLHLLGQYKQGMMQKLFSQQIRFKANDGSEFGDWEILKFKDVITIKYGKDHKKLKDGDIPVLGTGGIMRYVDSYLYDGESILIGRKGTIDKPQFISGKFWTVDTLFYTEIGEKIRPKFAFQQLLLVNWLNLNEATGVPSLNTTSIGNIELKVPSLEEQTKIANFLSAIDQKIDVVSEQLEQAKLWKKGLLQQMFV